MTRGLINRFKTRGAAALALLGLAARAGAGQFFELSFELQSHLFPRDPARSGTERQRTNTVRCVFGTNVWSIQGQFAVNAQETWWCTGTNFVRDFVITSELTGRSPLAPSFAQRAPWRVGERHADIISPNTPQPLHGMVCLTWLAFCSGQFLNTEGRRIEPPFPEMPGAFTDQTRRFSGPPGLPEQIELYAPGGGPLFCRYRALESTKVAGWTIPIRFEFTQYRDVPGEPSRLVWQWIGQVTALRPAAEPTVPPEVMARVGRYGLGPVTDGPE